jgi:ferredoxin-type protein NapH
MKTLKAKKTIDALPLVILLVFLGMGLFMWLKTKRSFFLFDLPYIGFSLFSGFYLARVLPKNKRQLARKVPQLLIGFYFLFFLCFVMKTNMQIEGFFFLAFLGVFTGATLHYSIAKIGGPLIFNRGFCGWACWTAMVLDFLPWKESPGRIRYLGLLRYLHFLLSLTIVFVIFFVFKIPGYKKGEAVLWMAVGNVTYYVIAILLSILLKDNRAFCKYICPIPVLQKATARFSIYKYTIDKDRCVNCKICEKSCPMDIKLLDYAKESKRILSTECILCGSCRDNCPKDAIKTTRGFDCGFVEKLNFKRNTKLEVEI